MNATIQGILIGAIIVVVFILLFVRAAVEISGRQSEWEEKQEDRKK